MVDEFSIVEVFDEDNDQNIEEDGLRKSGWVPYHESDDEMFFGEESEGGGGEDQGKSNEFVVK